MYDSKEGQAWLRLWVDRFGPGSRLGKYIKQDDNGLFYAFDDILDQLGQAFDYLGRLRRWDADRYDIFSQIGASIAPRRYAARIISQAPYSIAPENMPFAMMSVWPDKFDSTDEWLPRLLCFQRIRGGSFVPRGNVFYEAFVFWADRENKQFAFPSRFFIGVTSTGVVPLEMPNIKTQRINSKKGAFLIRHNSIGIPKFLSEWAVESRVSATTLVGSLFYHALTDAYEGERGIQINVSKGQLKMRFGIPAARAPYFFKERDFQATVNGARRRIFHHVVPHKRVIGNRVTDVSEHYRGVRRFDWKGYEIHITVPGHHHAPLSGFTSAATFLNEIPAKERGKYTTAKTAGRMLAGHIWRGGSGPH